MRPELTEVLTALLAASDDSREVTLDAIGHAIGARAVSTDDVDHLISALERAGRKVTGPRGSGATTADLHRVLAAARALTATLGRRPTPDEIARDTGLTPDAVRTALSLARVMSR